MRWFKKIVRAVLALLPVLSIFFIINGDSSALRHDYTGLLFANSTVPVDDCFTLVDGFYSVDLNNPNCDGASSYSPDRFVLGFDGDSSDSRDGLNLKYSNSILFVDEDGFYNNLLSGFRNDSNMSYLYYQGEFYSPYLWNLDYLEYNYYSFNQKFGTHNLPSFVDSSSPLTINCSTWFNGAVCPGLWNTNEYLNENVLPFPYSSEGFYRSSTYFDDSSGNRYNNTFSFNDLFNSYIPSFSRLSLPLNTNGEYFYNHENLTDGRSFDFQGVFEFDGSFAWHDGIDVNPNAYFRIDLFAHSRNTGELIEESFDCTANLVTVSGHTHLEYSCPVILPDDLIYADFTLRIDGGGNYVWITDDVWRFAQVFVVTDNDDTPGESFNTVIHGGGVIPGDAKNDVPGTSDDWFSNLINLFSFGFFNPFAPIFSMFSDGGNCASIPTIASMIHSNETRVCPWFDSSIRNIVTPVLGLSAMMLLFGFIVRWLGSRSGNLIEDSGGIDSGGFHFENKFRRNK